MKTCRLIIRKATGRPLVKIIYGDGWSIPGIAQEIKDFAVLNGYTQDALMVVDISEADQQELFADLCKAKFDSIRLVDGQLLYDLEPEQTPQPTDPPINQELADLYEAVADIHERLIVLEGGAA